MARKYQIKKIGGVRQAVPIRKDHERPPMPPPARAHKSRKDYDRERKKRELQKMF